MPIIELQIPSELVDSLEKGFNQGAMLNAQGLRSLSEVTIARVNRMSIVIQADEHPPPHFHVRFAGENASFDIASGNRFRNVRGLEKYEHNIQKWWSENYCILIRVWNETRPYNCPVGLVAVPKECK